MNTLIVAERALLDHLASVLDGQDTLAIERARRALRRFYAKALGKPDSPRTA